MIRVKELPRESYLTIIEETRCRHGQDWVNECLSQNLPIDKMTDLRLTLQGEYYWVSLSKKLESEKDKQYDLEAERQRILSNYENGLY